MRSEPRLALCAAAALALVACETPGPAPKQLATNQTLRLAIPNDVTSLGSLDPAQIVAPIDYAIGINVFGGLYRNDDNLREVPDIAAGNPDVSADGRIYTFQLLPNVMFSNGDPVTADDFVYSWNRAAQAQGDLADLSFGPIDGYQAIVAAVAAKQPAPKLSISAPNPLTLVVHLAAPSGGWLAGLAAPPAWVVDRNAITNYGGATWWTSPAGLVGTGPFRLTSNIPKQPLVFTPTEHWWGKRTGTLTRVELHVLSDAASQWQAYQTGGVDILGYGLPESRTGFPELASSLAPELEKLRSDPNRRGEIHISTHGRTEWVGFNFATGPFSTADGRALRLAFSQAIDRSALARAVCQHGWVCEPATGGLIAKGLQGYLGDGADPSARFDQKEARATIARLDPDGSRLRGLIYTYGPPSRFLLEVAKNLRDQWKANLGVEVTPRGLDRDTFVVARARGQLDLFRGSWLADYNHPQDWFDNLFTTTAERTDRNAGTGYSNTNFDSTVAAADGKPLDNALPEYQQAGRLLLNDHAIAVLFYYARTVVIKPYVDGYGANPLLDYRWTSIRIMQH